MRVLIAGAGIGGLSAAACLQRVGLTSQLFERAPELAAVGAGITIQTNALLALRAARPDLAEAIAAAGQTVVHVDVRDWRGRVLSGLGLGEVAAAIGGPPPVAIHRATLQQALLDACRPLAPALGQAARGYALREGEVELALEDGGVARGDLLIGADGIHSAIRRQLVGDGEPRYAGYTCWRGVTADAGDCPRDRVSEVWGPGARFGIVPIDGERVYWFATHSEPAGGRDPHDVHAALERLFGRWMAPIPRLVASTPAERILRNDITDRLPAGPRWARWGEGPVTLLGDAAHPMTPNLGQGACQAIEDAVVLAACLAADRADPLRALRAYEEARRPRARAIVLRAWQLGRVGQWRNGLLRWLRDLGAQLTPERTGRAMVEEVFRFPHEVSSAFVEPKP